MRSICFSSVSFVSGLFSACGQIYSDFVSARTPSADAVTEKGSPTFAVTVSRTGILRFPAPV